MKKYVMTALAISALGILPGCFWPFKRKKAVEQKKTVTEQVEKYEQFDIKN